MAAMYKKELQSYFRNLSGYIFVFFIILVLGLYTSVYCFSRRTSHFEYVYYSCNFLFLIAVPILTMRSLAEERRQKTDQLLYSLPVSTAQIVLGKYCAMVTVFAIPIAVSALYPLALHLYDPSGYMSFVTIYSVILAFFLMGCALIAIGLFMSSLTENQIIAAVLSFAAMLLCYLMGSLQQYMPTGSGATSVGFTILILALAGLVRVVTRSNTAAWVVFMVLEVPVVVITFAKPEWMENAMPAVFSALSVSDRFNNFIDGVFDVKALVYFVSVAVLFNYFTVQSLEKRRWS